MSSSAASCEVLALSASAPALAPATALSAARAEAILSTAAPLLSLAARDTTATGTDRSRASVLVHPATDSAPVSGPLQRTATPAAQAPAGKAAEKRPAQLVPNKVAAKAASVAEAISVSGRPVASLSALSSAMSLVTPDAGAAPPAADRTVKRVLQKTKGKTTASPPASSPRAPA